MSGRRVKYLTPEEIPDSQIRESLDFNKQKTIRKGKKSPMLHIWRVCRKCGTGKWCNVGIIRSRVHTFTGFCTHCLPRSGCPNPNLKNFIRRGPRKPLTEQEIRSEVRDSLDFSKQETRELESGYRQLHIWRTCLKCKISTWVPTANIRRRGKRFTGLCRSCLAQTRNESRGRSQKISRKQRTSDQRSIKKKEKTGSHRSSKRKRRKAKSLTTKEGYVLTLVSPDDPLLGPMQTSTGYVLEHRAIMARKLGRPLRDNEIVHHLNRVKDDNRPENLVVIPELHDLIAKQAKRIYELEAALEGGE